MILFMAILANAGKDLMVPIVNLITDPVNSIRVCRKVLVYLVSLSTFSEINTLLFQALAWR
jgi:hypothetical protein